MPNLSKAELFEKVLTSLSLDGQAISVIDTDKPFKFRVKLADGRFLGLRTYVWNCTHGGGGARPADEYRVQFTGAMPTEEGDYKTLILGWHSDYSVFAAWDIRFHEGQDSNSPSAQIREEALAQAHARAFASTQRNNGEIAIAFEPELLLTYALNSERLHAGEDAKLLADLLNDLPDLKDEDVEKVADQQRREVVTTLIRKFRAADFRKRVLAAYNHQCAACGVQLELIDAAHIEPVSEPTSTDETCNGIALCSLHHRAFDSGLLSFDDAYRVELSENKLRKLGEMDRVAGLEVFRANLRVALILPADRRDYPDPARVGRGKACRSWIA